ncbi:hypothetical protein FHT21_002778 [Pedobacter sp. SG908]|nr:hypothetical protein [Pedobacter sp. SG908]NMN37590.1 hypothetical protein [Pedobacter sp. SG918]
MKTDSSYLPLFFLCWAFLYSSLAVWSIWPVGGSRQGLVIKNKYESGQVPRNTGRMKPGPIDLTCFCCIDGNVSLVTNSEIDFISPSLQNPIKNIIKGPE